MMFIMSVQHHHHHHQKSGAFSRESKAKMHRTLATIGDPSRKLVIMIIIMTEGDAEDAR